MTEPFAVFFDGRFPDAPSIKFPNDVTWATQAPKRMDAYRLNAAVDGRVKKAVEKFRRMAVAKLRLVGTQYGCSRGHRGPGTKDCPREYHHHHDEKCEGPWEIVANLPTEPEGK